MKKVILILMLISNFISCSTKFNTKEHIASIQLVDHNNFSETIHDPRKLQIYKNINFNSHQPYKKVVLNKSSTKAINLKTAIYTYYSNGQLKQKLECVNHRANGLYQEWHFDGSPKLRVEVNGGDADISPIAEKSWILNGNSLAWNEEGCLIADITYKNGELHGPNKLYYPNGKIKEEKQYINNLIEGKVLLFYADGSIAFELNFKNGMKDGEALSYFKNNMLLSREQYDRGLLWSGEYFDEKGNLEYSINNGSGKKKIINDDLSKEIISFNNGVKDGEIICIDKYGFIQRTYQLKNNLKTGPEIIYFFQSNQKQSILNWFEGNLQGLSETWYDNGQKESSREISCNQKNGMSISWYRNGSLMMIEDYENDSLKKGVYHQINNTKPVSNVHNGEGLATIFSENGNFIRKIEYYNGRPVIANI